MKLADAPDSKSGGLYRPCGFDSHLRHQIVRKSAHYALFSDPDSFASVPIVPVAARSIFRGRIPECAGIDDRVPAIDALDLVPDHRHRGRAGYAIPFQVATRRAPHIVQQPPGYARGGTRGLPGAAHVPDRLPVPVKDLWDDPPCLLQPVVFGLLRLQEGFERRGEAVRPPSPFFGTTLAAGSPTAHTVDGFRPSAALRRRDGGPPFFCRGVWQSGYVLSKFLQKKWLPLCTAVIG